MGVLVSTGIINNLRGGGARKRCTSKNRSQHVRDVISGADIAGAGFERRHPHFFVRNAVSADNGQGRKVAVQTFDIAQAPILDVENHGFRTVASYIVPQFLTGAGYMH